MAVVSYREDSASGLGKHIVANILGVLRPHIVLVPCARLSPD